MRFTSCVAAAVLAFCQLAQVGATALPDHNLAERHSNLKISPKFFIISMVSCLTTQMESHIVAARHLKSNPSMST